MKLTRFLLHISSIENRNSILKRGLIPRSILKSNQFSSKLKIGLNNLYDSKKCIFVTQFKNDIDFYDIKEIRNYVFPLPLISAGFSEYEMDELIEKVKNKIGYYKKISEYTKIRKEYLKKGLFREILFLGDEFEHFNNEFSEEFNKECIKNAKNFDIWIIDTEGLKINFEEDGGAGAEAYYTTSRIPQNHLNLIKGNINYRKDYNFENKITIMKFEDWKLNEDKKPSLNTFVRFGNLTPKKQNGYGGDGYHSPPASKGFYAMPFKFQEFFLIGSISGTQPDVFGKNKRAEYFDDNKEIWDSIKTKYTDDGLDYIYDTPEKKKFKKDLDELDKKFKDKYRQIRSEFNVDDTKELWHHLGDKVDLPEIIQRHNAWVKTTVGAWKKAVRKYYGMEKTDKIQSGARYSKDHYEVFFEDKVA